jgi:hypothetical protein
MRISRIIANPFASIRAIRVNDIERTIGSISVSSVFSCSPKIVLAAQRLLVLFARFNIPLM